MVTTRLAPSIALATCLACAQAAFAAEPYVIYDDFATTTLDPARWSGVEHVRRVEGNALRLVQREWGLTTSDSGTQVLRWQEWLTRPGPITQLRAHVRVNVMDVIGCAPNATPSQGRADLVATFFNSGARVVGSNVGDVLALMRLRRASNSADAPGVLRVEALVLMCTSSDCSAGTLIGPLIELGTANLGVNTLLQVDWDRPNKQFLFSRDKGAPTAVPYTVNDSSSPGSDYKYVGTRTEVASCASAPRAYAHIDARFDNVAVNASVKP